MIQSFTTTEAAKLAHLSKWMVHYLRTEGIVEPKLQRKTKKQGSTYRYNFKEVLLLKVLGKLLEKGLKVRKIKHALSVSEDIGFLMADQSRLEVPHRTSSEAIRYFCTDGTDVFLIANQGEVVNLSKGGQLEFWLFVDIEQLHTELASQVEDLAARKAAMANSSRSQIQSRSA